MSIMYLRLSSNIDFLFKQPNEILASKLADKICWCYKWKKISKEECDELCDRMTKYFELY